SGPFGATADKLTSDGSIAEQRGDVSVPAPQRLPIELGYGRAASGRNVGHGEVRDQMTGVGGDRGVLAVLTPDRDRTVEVGCALPGKQAEERDRVGAYHVVLVETGSHTFR